MTVLIETSDAPEEHKVPISSNESMRAVLTAIRYDLSLDPAKTDKQINKRMGDLATVVNYIAKSLRTTPEQLTVSEAVESESIFLDYLVQSRRSTASKRQLPSKRNAVLRYARKLSFSPNSFAILDEWEPVQAAFTSKFGAPAIANDAIRRGRRPVEFSDADLAVCADTKLDSGGTYHYVRQAQSAFLTAIRKAGLQSLFPRLDVAVCRLPGYRFPMEDMPQPLRTEITEIVDSRRALAELGMATMAPATEREIIEHFEDLCGYAVSVCGIDVVGLDSLLREPFVKAFAFWLRNERKCKRTTVVGKLSRMFSALKTSPAFKGRDFSWVYGVYRKLRKEPESALKERRRQYYVAFQELAAIPERMRGERTSIRNPSLTSLGWRIHDELLLASIILAQWPPRFISMAELGRNVFKGSIPNDGPPFSVPPWAKKALCGNPSAEFWQFRYETPGGKLRRGLVLGSIVPLLELYVEEYQRLLVGPANAANFFCDRAGRPLRCALLGNLVSYQVWRYIRKRVTVTAIRSSFAYYWRDKHPNKDAVLAQIQWVDYATIKMRYDEEFRKQRCARMNRRKNLNS